MKSLRERILSGCSPEPMSGCWLWTKALDPTGYPKISIVTERAHKPRIRRAHIVAFEEFKGPILKGLVINHLCRVRCCVNPDHLEAVTPRQNVLHGRTFAARNQQKTHCDAGHPFSTDNTYLWHGQRKCRVCRREAVQRARLKDPEKIRAAQRKYLKSYRAQNPAKFQEYEKRKHRPKASRISLGVGSDMTY